MQTHAFGALSATTDLVPMLIERRPPGAHDVVIEIAFCGICHSDIHTARSEWSQTSYPCVPGHEIVGKVVQVGKKVRKFKIGDLAGVGCFVDSCGKCANCKDNQEQYCANGCIFTYDCMQADGTTSTQGGYSQSITVTEAYVLKIKRGQPLAQVAPLLCAGITTYSPLKRYKTRKGSKVGVIGLGGLGHIAVKLAAAMGAEVTVFSTSATKQQDAVRLGAEHFVLTSQPENFEPWAARLDLIIDTVSAPHDLSPYLRTLRQDGTHVLVGIAPAPNSVSAFSLIMGRKKLTGSLIGGILETQKMLDFCAKKKVLADIELISAAQINEAYTRTINGLVKYRFVIDAQTFGAQA